MCGFIGEWRFGAAVQKPVKVPKRLDRIAHRGPDGAGWAQGSRHLFGFRRLAILDLKGGMQPLSAGDLTLMVNGEIYNHHSLRTALKAEAVFQTAVDAEVVLHGYRAWGPGVLHQLEGMFALALVDEGAQRLFLARDRVGKKPLYYRVDGDSLHFASEIGPLLDAGLRVVDREALNLYLRFGYVPAPQTLFAGISKLPAGCALVADAEGYRVERWSPLLRVEPGRPPPAIRWAAEVREALDAAVRRRLESEVPLGFLLSGGVDSAAVFALGAMAKGDPVTAFTIGFSDAEVDETAAAAEVAACFRARHQVRVVEEREAPALSEVVHRCEEPLATDALLPTDRLFSAVRAAGITTVLAGEGSDEVFAGYRKFQHAVGPRSTWIASGASPLARYLSTEEFCFPTLAERRSLIGEAASDQGFEELQAAVEALSPLAQMRSLEVALRLPDRINLRLDRLSMAYAIEARAPFMDPKVMSLALQTPPELLLHGGTTKWILRLAMANALPGSVLWAPKAPFRAPDRWFVSGGRGLSRARVEEAGLVNPQCLSGLSQRAQAGDAGARERLYNLTVLHAWHERFFQGLGGADI